MQNNIIDVYCGKNTSKYSAARVFIPTKIPALGKRAGIFVNVLYSASMASVGQLAAQAPQSTHTSGSMTY